MSDRSDLVEQLLSQSRVPALSPDFAARVVAEAQRPDRPRAAPPPRRHWRRTAWTTVVAVNLLVASAVAAAFGGGRFVPETVVAATHRLVERLSPHFPVLHRAPPQRHVIHRTAAAPVMRPRPLPHTPILQRTPGPPLFRLHGRNAPMRLGPLHAGFGHRRQLHGNWPMARHWRDPGSAIGWRRTHHYGWHDQRRWSRSRVGEAPWQDRPRWRGQRLGRADHWHSRPIWRSPRPGRPWRGPRGRGPGGRRF